MKTISSYEELAKRFDVSLEWLEWPERQVTKPGLRNFLKRVAARKLRHNSTVPMWRQIYEQSTWAQEVALTQLHVRIPKRYSLNDRARVKFLVSREWIPSDEASVVMRWAEGA
jgi:hypothetical protein